MFEQKSWVWSLKCVRDLEKDKRIRLVLKGETYNIIIEPTIYKWI